jgi:stage V sporulation protein G
MNISEVHITLRDEEKLKCFANVTFDDCFVVRGLKVIQGTNGYFVSMPSRKRLDGRHGDIAHPTNMEMRKKIEDAVLYAYTSKVKDTPQEASGYPAVARELTGEETDTWSEQRRRSG